MTAGPEGSAGAGSSAGAGDPGPVVQVRAEASGQAQQAVLGQGVQHNHWYAAPVSRGAGLPAMIDTLVPPPRVMVGRREELAALRRLADDGPGPGRGVRLCVVHGMGGVGKTALVRALGADVSRPPPGAFPGGRIEVDLHGFTPGRGPRPPEDVLGELLALADVPAAQVPAGVDGRSQLWRAWLAERRVLLLLDNARDAGQVRPLLPGAGPEGGSLVLVTSRHALTELDPDAVLDVGLLPAPDAVELLRRVGGADDGADALAELAGACGRLPLALRSVGALLPRMDAEELVEIVESAEHPFAHLTRADQVTSAAFVVSYEALPEDLRETLDACARHPGPDFDAGSIAALAGRPRSLAAVGLAELLDASMLTGLPDRRYTFHDLFRGYAVRQVLAAGDPGTTAAARRRLYRSLRDRVAGATALVYPDNRHVVRPPGRPVTASREEALAWLAAAADELSTAAHAALADGWEEARPHAATLAYWLYAGGRIDQSASLRQALHDDAVAHDDPGTQAQALLGLGEIAHARGDSSSAADLYRRAHDLCEAADDVAGLAQALLGLGWAATFRGEPEQAATDLRRAEELAGRAGDLRLRCDALQRLGGVAEQLDRLEEAAGTYRLAHELASRAGYRSGQADALCGLAGVAQLRQDAAGTASAYQAAHDIYTDIGNLHGLAYALKGLGDAARLLGEHARAREEYGRADALYVTLGFLDCQAQVRCGLAEVELANGDVEAAGRWFREALEISERIGYPAGRARATAGLEAVAASGS